jgi:hypothetical protein
MEQKKNYNFKLYTIYSIPKIFTIEFKKLLIISAKIKITSRNSLFNINRPKTVRPFNITANGNFFEHESLQLTNNNAKVVNGIGSFNLKWIY